MSGPLSRARPRPALGKNTNPLVIAHRGASSDIAEHTLPAYLAAIDTGADGLECDVRLTRDGHLVCVHDRTVNRTSNGSGIVSELDLSGLRELDFRSWHDDLPGSPDQLLTNSPYLAGVVPDRMHAATSTVLTLETLLSVVADSSRPLKLLIETKHPTRYGGLVEKELVRMLKRFGWAGLADPTPTDPDAYPITIMSFAQTALRRIRLLAPAVPLVLLLERQVAVRRETALPTGVHTTGPGIKLVRDDPELVARAHAAGNRVFCWTVDAVEDVDLVRHLGVDAIITNRPALVRKRLDSIIP